MEELILQLKEIEQLLIDKVSLDFRRFLKDKIDYNQRLIGIVGPRGVGKTTLILQHLKATLNQSVPLLYFSADQVSLQSSQLFELARHFYLHQAGRLLCIDEIHRFKNWHQELKNIYDSFPDLKVIFSGSSSLGLLTGRHDLSRRAVVYDLPGLSFREYLALEKNLILDPLSIQELLTPNSLNVKFSPHSEILRDFKDYLDHGYYPFYKESIEPTIFFQRISNIIDKTIYEDIASVHNLKTENLPIFRLLLQFLATSSPSEINAHKLSRDLQKNHETITNYLEILSQTHLVRFLSVSQNGHGLLRNAKKIFLDNNNLSNAICYFLGRPPLIGTTRELFILNQLQNAKLFPLFSSTADLCINDWTLEVGGRSKKIPKEKQSNKLRIVSDDILIASGDRIPLYAFGLLY